MIVACTLPGMVYASLLSTLALAVRALFLPRRAGWSTKLTGSRTWTRQLVLCFVALVAALGRATQHERLTACFCAELVRAAAVVLPHGINGWLVVVARASRVCRPDLHLQPGLKIPRRFTQFLAFSAQ